MLLARIEERSSTVQAIESTERHRGVRNGFGEVRRLHSPERVVLECDCRARLVLGGHASVRRTGLSGLRCGVCGERFVLIGR